MQKQTNKKSFKFRLPKAKEVKISIETNFTLPRSLEALCNKSLLRRILKTPEKVLLKFLNILALGFELEHAARRYPSLLISDGLSGVLRHEQFREAALQRRILMQLKRRQLIEEIKRGNKLIYKLSSNGNAALLKANIKEINRSRKPGDKHCIIIFDIPEKQRSARSAFRRFLKECHFKKLQRSVWCADINVVPYLKQFIADLGIQGWIKIIQAEKII